MSDERDLLELHRHVLFDVDAAGRLTTVNEAEPEPAPRVFVARGRRSTVVRFRADVPPASVAAIERAVADLPGWDGGEPDGTVVDDLARTLERDAPTEEVSAGPAFRFGRRRGWSGVGDVVAVNESNAALLARHFPYTLEVLPRRSPVVGIVRDGAIVSACYAARRRPAACEAGVATIDEYRGQGFATAVVAAWRDAVEAEGRLPLYSTSWDNAASRTLAARLGLVAYADTVSIR